MGGFGKRLVELRGQESQAAWAKRNHVSQATVSAWESEKYAPPLDFLIEYAREKGKSLDWLLGNEVREEPGRYSVGTAPPKSPAERLAELLQIDVARAEAILALLKK